MKKLEMGFLSERELRQKLRQEIPQIDKLENLEYIRDLSLKKIETDPVTSIWYEGTVSPETYSHIRKSLTENGVIVKNKSCDTFELNEDQPSGYKQIKFGASGTSIKFILTIRNSNHKNI